MPQWPRDGSLIEKLGLPLGPRKKLLKAIAERSAEPPPAGATGATPPAPASMPQAERRQLTVMFCDLVGSTALSAWLDPEELGDLHPRLRRAGSARPWGSSSRATSPSTWATASWPTSARPRRMRTTPSARSGPASPWWTRSAACGPRPDLAPRVRVGIATGPVVVGELIGSGEARERAVVGETPNLAARLQALAEPDAVVIGRAHAGARRRPVRAGLTSAPTTSSRPCRCGPGGVLGEGAGLRTGSRPCTPRPETRSSAARGAGPAACKRGEQAADEREKRVLSGEP